MTTQTAGLHRSTIKAAFRVPGHDRSVSRALIDGAMVIYNTEDPPTWLRAVIRSRDEDGNTSEAMDVRGVASDGTPELICFNEGTSITGAPKS
jgi:hypothetical protein